MRENQTVIELLHAQKFNSAFAIDGAAPRTRVESAYLQLRRDIIEGSLAAGEKLRVEHLKDRYEVGAGTLREALALLLSDALVIAEGQRGFRVAPISLADIDDITRTRILLETEAFRQSIRNGGDDWEDRLTASFARLSQSEERLGNRGRRAIRSWEERNREFHEALIGACDSRWIRYVLGLVYRQHERYRHLALTQGTIARDVHAEHAEIFHAALARDVRRASAALAQHIRLTSIIIRRLATEYFESTALARGPGKARRPVGNVRIAGNGRDHV